MPGRVRPTTGHGSNDARKALGRPSSCRWSTAGEGGVSALRQVEGSYRAPGRAPGLLHKPHAALLAHLGFDAVLGFELLQELFHTEFGRQDVGLALDGSKVARRQLLQF